MKRKFVILSTILTGLSVSGCNSIPTGNTQVLPAAHVDKQISTVKKGVGSSRYAQGSGNYHNTENNSKIDNLNVGWYYNWGNNDPSNFDINAEYVPMIWGKNDLNTQTFNKIKQMYEDKKINYLLTFNEPDITNNDSTSCNMTVDEAIAAWPSLMELGLPLSSPAPASYVEGAWLDQFMAKIKEKDYRVDFIAVHCYQDFSINGIEVELKNNILEVLYRKYQLPIWITEFGCIDIQHWANPNYYNPKANEEAAIRYTNNCVKMLESLGYVERYAWFLDNFTQRGESYLNIKEGLKTTLYKDDDTISPTGEAFKNIESVQSLEFETKRIPNQNSGTEMNYKILVKGGKGDYTFSATGLPRGVTMDIDGTIHGKLNQSDIHQVKITVQDEAKQTLTKNFSLYII